MERPLRRREFLRQLGGRLAVGAVTPAILADILAPSRAAGEAGVSPTREPTALAVADPNASLAGGAAVPPALAQALPDWLRTARVPGLVVATLRGGRLAGVQGFGVRDAESKDPVQAGTIFEAASLSKVVTAYCALRLVQAGKLALDTPLATYAPSPCPPNQALAAKITLRHALSHSTGLRNWRFRQEDELNVDFEPGTRWSYSGEGFMWVERAIEAVTGQPFARHVLTTLFQPLGMKQSSFVWRPEFDSIAARGHDEDGKVSESWVMKLARKADEVGRELGKSPLEWTYADAEQGLIRASYPVLPTMATPNAAGSLFTTAGEYALFFSRVLENKATDATSLADDLRAAMRSPQIRAAGLVAWGLGVGLETDRTPAAVWHWGDSGPAKTFALGDPASGDGVVVFTNGSRGLQLCERITSAVMGSRHAAFLFV